MNLNRERIAWLVASLMLGLLAFQLNGTLAHRDDDYSFVRTLVDIHRQVTRHYVDPIDQDKLRQGAIDGMLEQLDPYSQYVPPAKQEEFDRHLDGTFKGIGVRLDQAENGDIRVLSPIEGSPAYKAGVLAGDVVLTINDEPVKGQKLKDVIDKIAAGPLEVRMRVRHETGQEVDLPLMVRQEIILPTVLGLRRKADKSWDWYANAATKIAYLRITQFTPDTFDKVKGVLEPLVEDGMKALVLDLRFNPGGRLDQAEKIVDLFVEEGTIVVTRGRNRPEETARAEKKGTLPQFPMIVLVNEHSASASEVVAGSLQDNHRAIVLGERSFGKGSVQEVIPLENRGGELKLTVAYYYLPSGRLVHRKKDATDWGVEPQIKIAMNADQQRRLLMSQADAEVIGKPVTRPATTQPTTMPTGPVDPQLDAAIATLVANIVNGEGGLRAPGTAPSTVTPPTNVAPASQPVAK